MLPNKRLIRLIQIAIGCIALAISTPTFAANWLVAPYGFGHGGARCSADWSLDLKDKFSWGGATLFGGSGILFNPSTLDDWMISVEALYHLMVRSEDGLFILGKLTFPTAEGIENFIGLGLGSLRLIHPLKEKESRFSAAVILQGGRNWHMGNGYYFTIRGSYLLPAAENRKQSLSLTLGIQWNWI